MLIDTHAHLTSEYYDDIKQVLNDSAKLGIDIVVNSGCDSASNEEVLKIAKNLDNMYVTLGIHPEFANCYQDKDIKFIIDNLADNKVVAIGEIGLDYHYDGYDMQKQKELFEKQLKIAEEHNLPVVIHSRDATSDTINILKKYSVTGIIHCFSGSKETAREYIKLGYKLGIGGVCTYKNAKVIEVIKEVGLENIVLETDSPYLAPVPVRGTQNIPGNISFIVDFISNSTGILKEDIIKITRDNTLHIFDKIIVL